MSQVRVTPGDPDLTVAGPSVRAGRSWSPAVVIIIVATSLLAVGLRLYELSRPGYLFGMLGYDDGAYVGSAIRLFHGWIPYRDFVIVHPPGITLLLTPIAWATSSMGTNTTMAAARLATALASAAGVPLIGLLVRHRGALATLAACGVLAVFPDSLLAARTVLLEPWLVLFCLLGLVAIFDGDQLAGRRRLVWGGLAFGFAAAVKVWAILPVLVILVILVVSGPGGRQAGQKARRVVALGAGVTAGFGVPVLPFALSAPVTFVRSVITAQLTRSAPQRTPTAARLQAILGLSHTRPLDTAVLAGITLAAAAAVAAAMVAGSRLSRRPLPQLDMVAAGTLALLVAVFLWPADFYTHYAAFSAPFLAIVTGLAAARLVDGVGDGLKHPGLKHTGPDRAPAWLRVGPLAVAAVTLAALSLVQARSEAPMRPALPPGEVAAVQRLVPPGACVVSDQASSTIAIDRFNSMVPGCPVMVDGVGSDYSLSGGLNGMNGAGGNPVVERLWMSAFQSAQYVWLSHMADARIPRTPALRAYFKAHFTLIRGGGSPLYVRNGLRAR